MVIKRGKKNKKKYSYKKNEYVFNREILIEKIIVNSVSPVSVNTYIKIMIKANII